MSVVVSDNRIEDEKEAWAWPASLCIWPRPLIGMRLPARWMDDGGMRREALQKTAAEVSGPT